MRVLGPLELSYAGENLVPSAPKPRQLLGLLMLNANRMVRATDCIVELWGTQPPKSAMSTLQTYVLNIRQALRTPEGNHSDVVSTRNQGYQLAVLPQDLDRARFAELAGQGRSAAAAGDPASASRLFADALALWRGPALADVDSGAISAPHLVELEETRKAVHDQRIEADLALGRHREMLDELSALASLRPTDENLQAQLMIALYRSGERSRATAVFRRLSRVLGEHIGIEPAPRMRRLHRAILTDDPILTVPVARVSRAGLSSPAAQHFGVRRGSSK
ncbi:AfsR/SARP family transcriptional regulator [Streptacidiphilus anmyonensis]|uniref:AfsR/SARP family transcriptional regulator n=1 Tax=Streptacidiphilus anmyonensis TaxID=405782 RepID=UPI000A050664|nr:AfsR/SARP family transcriptional regulator [Streptacidiphilus anmyonensis]